MLADTPPLKVTWELLPDDYVLPDDPVDNTDQPVLAAALTDSLDLANRLPETALVFSNYAICATVNDRLVIKAPDWGYVADLAVPRTEVNRSYTPQLQGGTLAIVMEFLSATEGGEYSIKATHPPGKYFFYERVLQVPNYAIFEPTVGTLELYRHSEAGYRLQSADEQQRYWISELNLFLGVWEGTRANRTGYWLRWWDQHGDLLLWGTERVEQERQRTEQERQRAERLVAQLRAAGIEPES